MQTLRSFFVLLTAAVGSAASLVPASTAHAQQGRQDKRPNIVFIFTDDHASHAMSCYGSKINRTPNLDRIADEGMLFNNCFCTNSICGPSRAVILTGKHSHLNGFLQNGNKFDGTQQTFPKLLQKTGYSTAMIGKWHLSSDPTGFDYWQVLRGQGPYYNPNMKEIGNPGGVKHTGYTTDIITDVTLDWLKNKRAKNKPFMLMTQHKAPHRNWQPGPKHLTMYDDVEIPEPENLFDDYANRGSAAKQQDMTIAETMTPYDLKLVPQRGLNKDQLEAWNAAYEPKNREFREANLKGKELVRWKYQRYMKDYLRCVASVDDNVGRLLDYLDESGLAENTVVIYSSDQGFYLGDHGWFDKRFMYEESLRMPLLVRWPGRVKPGTKSDALVQNLDFGPTFLDVAGFQKTPEDMQGESIKQILVRDGRAPRDWRDAIYYHYYEFYADRKAPHMVRRHYGVRTERFKLIYFYNLDEWELYDLQSDPREMNNVYGQPIYRQVTEKLKEKLAELREKYKVPEDAAKIPKDPPSLQKGSQNE